MLLQCDVIYCWAHTLRLVCDFIVFPHFCNLLISFLELHTHEKKTFPLALILREIFGSIPSMRLLIASVRVRRQCAAMV